MASDEQPTTTLSPATITILVGVLYHALEGGAVYDQAIADAQRAGNQDLATFLQHVQQEDQQRVIHAQQILAQSADDDKGIPDLQN